MVIARGQIMSLAIIENPSANRSWIPVLPQKGPVIRIIGHDFVCSLNEHSAVR